MRPSRHGRSANLLATFAWFCRIELALRRAPLPVVARRLGVRLSEGMSSSSAAVVLPWWTRGPVTAAARVGRWWPVGPEGSCLRESLVLARRLRELDPEVALGVRLHSGSVRAHAWVIVGGSSLDPSAEAFVQLPVSSA